MEESSWIYNYLLANVKHKWAKSNQLTKKVWKLVHEELYCQRYQYDHKLMIIPMPDKQITRSLITYKVNRASNNVIVEVNILTSATN